MKKKKNEKKRCSGAGMGYCPFLMLGHDTADCIVTQQGLAHARGHDTAKKGRRGAQKGAATRSSGAATRLATPATRPACAQGRAATCLRRPGHRGVSRYNFLS